MEATSSLQLNHVCRQIERSYKELMVYLSQRNFVKRDQRLEHQSTWEHTQQQAEEAAATVLPKQVVSFQIINPTDCFVRTLGHIWRLYSKWTIHGRWIRSVVHASGYCCLTNTRLNFQPMISWLGWCCSNWNFACPASYKYCQAGDPDWRRASVKLNLDDQKCVYEIAAASRDFAYRIKAGTLEVNGSGKSDAPRVEKVCRSRVS